MMHEFIYKVGAKIRNNSLGDYYSFLKGTEYWSRDKLLTYQMQKCRSFLEFANEHSPYYNAKFKEIGFVPPKMQCIDDLKKIPVIDKSTLREHSDLIHTHYPFKKKILAKTSGTSGQSLAFYRDEEWDSHNRAALHRGFSWYNVKPWERSGYFRGYNPDSIFTSFVDWMQNRKRIFSYKDKDVIKFIEGLGQVSYLEGYSSMIYEIAKVINRLDIRCEFKLKMIKGTSEKIYDSYQPEIIQAFGRKMISEYGAAEAGLIAYECPEGNMHINVENVVVEVEDGQIIVTNLLSKSFPITRYKLGDFVSLAEPSFECACGRKHPVLLEVLGRVGKKIVGFNNSYSSFTLYYVFKNLAIHRNLFLNYQAVQKEKGIVILRIEQSVVDVEGALRKELVKYFGTDVNFIIQSNQSLIPENGKFKDFTTYLN